ncbi:hypothetical protein LCGC14_2026170 [marine sediment metagenome]|uniref:Uncharacterized protein n=1 Tax=marine sediment metagenome TaxID=412755 RepID=A0A0F9HT51_9ZZZZ
MSEQRISEEEVQRLHARYTAMAHYAHNDPAVANTGVIAARDILRLLAERKKLLARIKELEAAAAALRAALRQHPEGLCYYCSSLLDD